VVDHFILNNGARILLLHLLVVERIQRTDALTRLLTAWFIDRLGHFRVGHLNFGFY